MNNNIVQFKYGQGEIVSKLSNDQKETEISSDYRHYLMVDLPCFVRTLPSALAMLGLPSIESVSNNSYECTNNQEHSSVSSLVNCSKSLQFRFPDSKDPFRHELQTNLHQQGPSIRNGLLVRLKRNKRTGKITTEILGGVSKGFSFEQPADYHFLPSSTGILPATTNLPDETTTERNSAERSLPTILLETLPESFSRSNVNKLQILSMTDGLTYLNLQPNIDVENSQHIDKPTNDDLNADEDAENNNLKRRKVRFVTTPFVGFGTPLRFENPKGPHPLRWKNCPPSHKGLQMIQLLKSIFELIPVLSKNQLVSMLDIEGHVYLFNDCLPYAAYCFTNGPFKSLWVRYGYDPTAAGNSDSRIYQTVNFRVSTVILHDLTKRALEYVGQERAHNKYIDLDTLVEYRVTPTFAHLPACIFGHMIKYMFSIQVYSFTNVEILEFINRATLGDECSKVGGWYDHQSIDGMRNLVLKLIAARFEAFFSNPLTIEGEEFAPHAESTDAFEKAVESGGGISDLVKPVAVTSELVINRDVHPPTSFLHNLSSSKAFPSIQVVSLPTLAAYLAEESAYKTASSVQQIYDIASELAVKSSIAPNNLIIWLKVYRLMQSVDFGMNHSRNRRLWASFANPIITPSIKTSEEVESNLRLKPIKPSKKTQKNSELVENAAAVQSMNSISDVYSEISDRNSMNAIIDDVEEHQFHNNSASSNSNRNSNSNIDQQVLLGHRIQTILQPCKVASNSMNSFNFSEVKGYAVFDDDDEDDDDSSEMDHGSYDGGIPNDEYEEYDGE